MPSFGIGENILGGTDPIQQALARRRNGQSTSPLSQVSGSAPSFQSGAAPASPMPAPQGAMPTQGAPTGAPVGPVEKAETELIINALGERLKAISKVEYAKIVPPTPPTPQAPMPSLGGL